MKMSTKKIRSNGAFIIKAAESRPPRNRAAISSTNGRTTRTPSGADRRAARALQQQKQR
jgi:hypothetical protein